MSGRWSKSNQDPWVREVAAYQKIARDIQRKKLMALSKKNNSLGRLSARLGALPWSLSLVRGHPKPALPHTPSRHLG
ncbi:MAG: hypothetical protein P4L66_05940 [Acetobacteraceae bacterium]|nr:hypothetical protein [Acetobacteraceae bacterium]